MSERYNPDRYFMQETEPTRIQQDITPEPNIIQELGATALNAMDYQENLLDIADTGQPDPNISIDEATIRKLGAAALDTVENSQSTQTADTERFQPYMETVSANDISGVDTSDPGFWNHHGYDKDNYMQLAAQLPVVQARMQQGATYEELRNDPELSSTVRAYYSPDNPITIEKETDGSFTFGSDGRHRIAAAQELGYDVDAKVIYDHGWFPLSSASSVDKVDEQINDLDTETPSQVDIILESLAQDLAAQTNGDVSFKDGIVQVDKEVQGQTEQELFDVLPDERPEVAIGDIEDHPDVVDKSTEGFVDDTVNCSDLADNSMDDFADDTVDYSDLSDEPTENYVDNSVDCSDLADDLDMGSCDDSSFDAADIGFSDGGCDSFV